MLSHRAIRDGTDTRRLFPSSFDSIFPEASSAKNLVRPIPEYWQPSLTVHQRRCVKGMFANFKSPAWAGHPNHTQEVADFGDNFKGTQIGFLRFEGPPGQCLLSC